MVDYDLLTHYYQKMRDRDRALIIMEDRTTLGWLTYFLFPTAGIVEWFHRHKKPYGAPPDFSTGSYAYIDWLYTTRWNKLIRQSVEDTLSSKHPEFTTAIWYRPRQDWDHKYTRNRRGFNETVQDSCCLTKTV